MLLIILLIMPGNQPMHGPIIDGQMLHLQLFLPNRYTKTDEKWLGKNLLSAHLWMSSRGRSDAESPQVYIDLVVRDRSLRTLPRRVIEECSRLSLRVLNGLAGWTRCPPLPSLARAATIRPARKPNSVGTAIGMLTSRRVRTSPKSILGRLLISR